MIKRPLKEDVHGMAFDMHYDIYCLRTFAIFRLWFRNGSYACNCDFFPLHIAIAFTAIIHLLHNIFKLLFLWRHINRKIVVSFGIPALVMAIPGALVLDYFSTLPPLYQYSIFNHEFFITPIKLGVGTLLIIFARTELAPFVKLLTKIPFGLPLGGALIGFFSGV